MMVKNVLGLLEPSFKVSFPGRQVRMCMESSAADKTWRHFRKLCAALINCCASDLAYTCISLVRNVEAPLHVDRNNAKGSENAIVAISDFSGGGLWVEPKQGSIPCPDGQHNLRGDVFEFQDRVIRFEPHLKHSTMPWSGVRVVLIAFTIQRRGTCLRTWRVT